VVEQSGSQASAAAGAAASSQPAALAGSFGGSASSSSVAAVVPPAPSPVAPPGALMHSNFSFSCRFDVKHRKTKLENKQIPSY
jgi:hypothetical protein